MASAPLPLSAVKLWTLVLCWSWSALLLVPVPVAVAQRYNPVLDEIFPEAVHLRAPVLTNTVPLAYYDENYTTTNTTTNENEYELFPQYRGFQPDLLRRLVDIALDFDNITLTFELEQAPAFSYGRQFEYMSATCNTTRGNPRYHGIPNELCHQYDLVIGDFYGFPGRSIQTLLTPPLLTTAAAAVDYVLRKKRKITTLQEAQVLQEPVCLLDESFYNDQTTAKYPNITYELCFTHEECIQWLKAEKCALFVEDELQLRYLTVQDADLEVTPERFDEVYIVWPLNVRLDPLLQKLVIRWIYQAKVSGVLDELYNQYFQVSYCPLGWAGVKCDLPCSYTHGVSNRRGQCVCESTKWKGADCSVEVTEDLNMIPSSLLITCYVMAAVNFAIVLLCAIWLFVQRNKTIVRIAQPMFLSLILLGCLISTSTIIALAQENEGNGPVPSCQAIPWLYSVGFSITFGTLFAKIRRVYMLFNAAVAVHEKAPLAPTPQETFAIIGMILALDITILICWTVIDPLEWQRTVETADKFGEPLSSSGTCTSEDWIIFAGLIAALHLALMVLAVCMCYVSRLIPTALSESKYLSIAMFSNLQIFVIGLPVLAIAGGDPSTSFFVRCAIIFINDLVVVTLIFGNLIFKQYTQSRTITEKDISLEQIANQNYQEKESAASIDKEDATKLVSNMLLQTYY